MNKMNMRARTKKMRWKTGDPLTQRDWQMLEVVIRQAKRLGYTPTSKEVLNAGALKQRFGTGPVSETAGGHGLEAWAYASYGALMAAEAVGRLN